MHTLLSLRASISATYMHDQHVLGTQLRQSLRFRLVDDLCRLSDSLPEEDNGFFPALYRHYAEVRHAALVMHTTADTVKMMGKC